MRRAAAATGERAGLLGMAGGVFLGEGRSGRSPDGRDEGVPMCATDWSDLVACEWMNEALAIFARDAFGSRCLALLGVSLFLWWWWW